MQCSTQLKSRILISLVIKILFLELTIFFQKLLQYIRPSISLQILNLRVREGRLLPPTILKKPSALFCISHWWSCPVFSYAVGQVSRKCENPNQYRWKARVTQIFACLNGTVEFRIWLGGNRNGLTSYTNADYAGDRNDYRSTSREIVSFSSIKQLCTALCQRNPNISPYVKPPRLFSGTQKFLLENFTVVEQKKYPFSVIGRSATSLQCWFYQRTKHVLLKYQ